MGVERLTALLFGALLLGSGTLGCGASEDPPAAPADPPPPEQTEVAEADSQTPPEPEAPPEPEEPPAPEPIDVEAGVRLGPIRVGMSQADLDALGLEVAEVDPRSQRYGPYRVWVRDGAVSSVEAAIGDLERIRYGGEVFEAGVDIYTLRDAFESCVWQEGGGERYRCAEGALTVRTEHSMNPQRYVLGVRSR